ncbi:MAG: FecR domain-containing protein [Gallionella sp.]
MKSRSLIALLVLAAMLLSPVLTFAATSAGDITRLTGDAVAQARAADGNTRKLLKGDAIYSGDTISTGPDTTLDILFADGSRFSVGQRSAFVVDKFVYNNNKEGDSFHSHILKGLFRFVSGLIAKSQNRDMTVGVSVATIGIRGTHVQGEVSERQEKDGVIVEASAKVMLLEPEEEGKQTSIVVSNEFGSVVVDKPGYGTEIPDEKSPPSPVRKMQLHTIDNIQRAIRNSVRQSGTARPRM